jgi:hypothetical protein
MPMRTPAAGVLLVATVAASACAAPGGAARAAPGAEARPLTLRLDANTTYQTFEGWGIVLPCWLFRRAKDPKEAAALYDRGPDRSGYSEDLNRKLAAEMVERGFNRFRLEVGPQVEFFNDNADPNVLNPKAFRFKWQDAMVREQLLPMKRLVEARRERAIVYVSYDLGSGSTPAWLLQPAEYAEMACATLKHLKDKFGLAVDYWSVLNEPGNGGRPGNPKLVAELTAATGRRIRAAGFKTRMSGPECVTPRQVDAYMKAMVRTPGALDHFAQITYHLYWDPMTIPHRHTIRDWARKLRVTAAQTEWMEQKDLKVAEHVFLCLTEADAVAWERYAWDLATNVRAQTFRRKSTAWYVRQYSRYIRPGSVRVRVAGADGTVKPVAFLSPRKKPVIVILNKGPDGRALHLTNLPPGRYEHSYVGGGRLGRTRAATVGATGRLELTQPAGSVLTVTADPP